MNLVLDMPKRVIDISEYWPTDENGKRYTVNKVWTDRGLNPEEVGRYTLQKALSGDLGGGEIDTIDSLMRLCAQWSSKKISYEDIVRAADEPSND